jgi:hypothetical protein
MSLTIKILVCSNITTRSLTNNLEYMPRNNRIPLAMTIIQSEEEEEGEKREEEMQ